MQKYKILGFFIIICLLFDTNANAISEITVSQGRTITIPVVIDQEINNIIGIDIEASFDQTIMKAVCVRKAEKFSNYTLFKNLNTEKGLDISLATTGLNQSINDPLLFPIVYIDFQVFGQPLSKTILSLDSFTFNDNDVVGGLKYQNNYYEELIITIDESCDIINDNQITIEDAILLLQLLKNNDTNDRCNPTLKALIKTLQILSSFNISEPNKRVMTYHTRSIQDRIITLAHKQGDIITIPITIDEFIPVQGVTIKLSFDESVVDAKSVTIVGGIVENYLYTKNLIKEDSAILLIYTYDLSQTNDDQGIVAYFTFEVKDIEKETDIYFSEFLCNRESVSGGFSIDNNTYDIIHIRPIHSYTITVFSSGYGSITPNGIINIDESSDINLSFKPDDRFQIKDVRINGQSYGNIASYSLTNIQQNYDVYVQFSLIPQLFVTSPVGNIQTIEDTQDLIIDLSNWAQVIYSDEIHAITQTIMSNSNPELVQANLDQSKLILFLKADQSGSAHIQLMGETNCCAPVFEDFTITVLASNDPPQISPVPTQIINEGQSIESISLTITDIDSPTDNIRLWATSSNPELIPAQKPNIVFKQSETIHQMIITPVYPGFGDVTLTVFASDDQDYTSTSFLVSIRHVEHTIHAIVGQNGKINHPDVFTVPSGKDIKYKIIPDNGYRVENVMINEKNVGSINEYVFWSISDDYTITVSFQPASQYTIVTHCSTGGQIVPQGPMILDEGKNQTFTIISETGYQLKDVLINGVSIGPVTSYSFKHIDANQTIQADFLSVTAPVANFEITNHTGIQPLKVHFLDHSKYTIDEWQWDFGDGFVSAIQNAHHTYSQPGKYTVALMLSGPGGTDIFVKTDCITVLPKDISFVSNKQTGFAPLSVVFSEKNNGNWIQQWHCGNGVIQESLPVTCTYTEPGHYTVMSITQVNDQYYTITYPDYIQVYGRQIRGNVSDSNGNPVSGCQMLLWGKSLEQPIHVTTDSNGDYTFTHLPATNLLALTAWPSSGLNYEKKDYCENRPTDYCLSTMVENIDNLDIVLQEKSKLGFKGRVINHKNERLANILVEASSRITDADTTTRTDEQGNYTFTGLPLSNDYIISAFVKETNRQFYYAQSDHAPYTDPLVQHEFVCFKKNATPLTPNDPLTDNVNIYINLSHNITGQVLDVDGNPINQIWVKAWSGMLNIGSSTQTDEYGNYTISGLMAFSDNQAVTYVVDTESSHFVNQIFALTSHMSEACPVTAGSSNVYFVLTSFGSISGHIVNEYGIPVPGVEIEAWSSLNFSEKRGNTRTDMNGNFTITNLPIAQDYIVAAFPKNYPPHYYASNVSIITGNATQIDFMLDKGAIIYGNVYVFENDIQSAAPAGIKVNVWSDSTETGGVVLTDENGYYEIANLLDHANDYIISVHHVDYVPSFFNSESEKTTTHTIQSAERVPPSYESRIIVLDKGIDIAGKVTFNDISVPEILVAAKSELTGMVKSTFSTSGNDGNNFIIKGIPANDSYTISVRSDDYMEDSIYQFVDSTSIKNIHFSLNKKEDTRIIHGKIAGLEAGKEVRIYASSSLLKIEKAYLISGSGLNSDEYTITGLQPSSDYIVRLISTDYPDMFYNNSYQQQDAHKIDLTSNNVLNADFTLPQNQSKISGSIHFPENAIKDEQVCINAVSKSINTKGRICISYNGDKSVLYMIEGLIHASDYLVSVQSDNYQNIFYDQVFIKDEARLVNLEHSEAIDIDFFLTRGIRISGKIYDNYNNPLPNIDVSAYSERTESFGKTTSLSDGSYMIEGLDFSDDFVITAKKSNQSIYYYSSHTQCVTNYENHSFVSTQNGNLTDTDIVICNGEQICGTVRNTNGEYLNKIKINVWSEHKNSGGINYTENDGSYCLEGIPHANDYQVSAIPDPTSGYLVTQKNDISSNSKEIDFYLTKGYQLDGVVYNTENSTIPDVNIKIRSLSKQIETTTKTDSNGNFIITGLPDANDYIIKAEPAENMQLSTFMIDNIVIHSNCSKTIILQPGLEFSGHIYDSTQIPMEGASIIVYSSKNDFQRTTTSTVEGEYRITNVPNANDYLIIVHQDGYERQQIKKQRPSENTDYYLSHSGMINGTITNANGLPIPNAFVMVYCEALDIKEKTFSNENGEYVITGLKTYQNGLKINDYKIIARIDGYLQQSKNNVSEGDDIHFILSNKKISGTVSDLNGNLPPPGTIVKVYLYELNGEKWIYKTNTDHSGSFVFKGLDANTSYQLFFRAVGNVLESRGQWTGMDNIGVSKDSREFASISIIGNTINFQFTEEWNVEQ
ncbi:secreted protein containing PKD domain protein [Candidatus Magnetomorum sp. HK-1]|nr:secreted protein containing PKD domain protein [Candidatus Magnetomorum sp. HK-1]